MVPLNMIPLDQAGAIPVKPASDAPPVKEKKSALALVDVKKKQFLEYAMSEAQKTSSP